jgi:hypothetical protein
MPFFPDGAVLQSFTVERSPSGKMHAHPRSSLFIIQYPCHNAVKKAFD